MVLYFIIGLGTCCSIILQAFYVIEMLPKETGTNTIITMFMFSRIHGVILILVLRFLTQDDKYWIWYNVGLSCVTLTIFWFLPETPQFLYAKGRYDECKQVLLTIAKANGADVRPEQFQFDILKDEEQKNTQTKNPEQK